ncbi:hypothetical protein MO867_10590 [Microbulbifer sp. OS29]|uniref:Uncharacterized protein n=1 Tax=Microbulbifer okhotskensis TaxID=2926617 RepID=A0A9X2EM50_9GAMM|nr:hypothetical protein [Microbulbifer okhotskensis]MCO1334787.1 hypothetical protein [Microbulbifer okhotskensis]
MRKLLPVPAAILAWCLAVYLTLLFDEWYVLSFCPHGMHEGSVCYEEGWELWPTWIVSIGVALSALMAVWAAALAAVANAAKVALWTFLIGAPVALSLGILAGYLFSALLAVVAGGVAYWIVEKASSGKC